MAAQHPAGRRGRDVGPEGTLVRPDETQDAVTTAPDAEQWARYAPTTLLDALLDKAVTLPSHAIRAHVERVRARNPQASPEQVVRYLEKEYLTVVAAAGGAVGAAAAFPAVGTGVGIALTSSDIATFFASSAAFALAVADVHGIAVDDVGRRRALLLATVLGDKGARDVENAVGGSTVAWGKVLLTSMPQGTLRKVNKALTNRFVRTQLAKQGGLAIGRLAPFGIGAVVGVAGGRALGHGVVAQSRRAFGPPPVTFPRVLEVLPGGSDDAPPLLVPAPEPEPRRRLLGRGRRRER